MKKALCASLLFLSMTAAAPAEQVFVRNRPFLPVSRGIQGAVIAELPALCQALELGLRQNGSQWLVTLPGQEPVPLDHERPGVFFGNVEVGGADVTATPPQVDLQLFIKAVGGRYARNPAMQTIDVFPAPTAVAKSSGKRCAVASDSYRLVVFNSGDKPPSQLALLAPKLAKDFPLTSVYVDTTKSASPSYQQFSTYLEIGSLPYAVLLNPAGRSISSWRGMPKPEQVAVKAKEYVARRKAVNGEPVQAIVEEVGT